MKWYNPLRPGVLCYALGLSQVRRFIFLSGDSEDVYLEWANEERVARELGVWLMIGDFNH